MNATICSNNWRSVPYSLFSVTQLLKVLLNIIRLLKKSHTSSWMACKSPLQGQKAFLKHLYTVGFYAGPACIVHKCDFSFHEHLSLFDKRPAAFLNNEMLPFHFTDCCAYGIIGNLANYYTVPHTVMQPFRTKAILCNS